MANELKHGSVGTELTQAEWEGIGTHVFESQATGDIVYASSSSQLRRLAKGTDTHVLILSSGVPAWSASTGITAVGTLTDLTVSGTSTTIGTVTSGVWQGTDVGVAYGGTGVSTLTDGGILLGSGTSAITAMAVLTDGQMIVGDGTTDPVAESGATLRTSVGVGTGDSPQFTNLTLTGDLAVNGTDITSTGALTVSPVGSLILDIAEGNAAFKIVNAAGTKMVEIDSRTTAEILMILKPLDAAEAASQYTVRPTLELAISTLTLSGSTGVDSLDAGLVVRQLTVTDTSSLTVAQAHTVYIAGAPIAAGSVTITEPLALFVDSGTSRFDGNINMNSTGTLLNVGASGNDFVASGITVASSADSAAVADEVSFGRYEIGAGNTVIALSQETAVATETDETKFSHKMQVRLNGATYYMMLTAS
jgi:hypothetical protein